MKARSRTIGSNPAFLSAALLARLTARRHRNQRRWVLRLLAGAGGLWLVLIVVGSLTQSA